MIAALDLPPDTGALITDAMMRGGSLQSIAGLTDLDAPTRAALAGHVSFLPAGGNVNLNTADAVVMAAVLQNRTAAQRLATLRDRNGFVTAGDLSSMGLVAAAGAGFRSDVFDVTIMAQVADVTVTLTSRLMRQSGPGTQSVRVIARQFGPIMAMDAMPPIPPDALLQ